MDWLHIAVLALVQGITEFLPVSSSAHLILVPRFTAWADQGLAFDVAVHVGSLTAVVWYFRRDIGQMITGFFRSLAERQQNEHSRLAWFVVVGTIPVGLAGILTRDWVESYLRSPLVMVATLIGFGLLLGWADWRFRGGRTVRDMRWRDAIWIGLAQAIALIPGTSRSGITMTAALILGMSREASARFSFLLSIPVIALAGLLEVHGLITADTPVDWNALIWGAVLSGISAYLCIVLFLAFIRRIGMQPFVIYRVALGLLLLVVFWP